MKPFRYERPGSATEAVGLAVGEAEPAFLAGGTNLVDLMRLEVATPRLLVDVRDLGLAAVQETTAGGLLIGAATTNSALAADPRVQEQYPVLCQALLSGASPQLRNRATAAGNLLQRTRCAYFQDTTKPCNKRDPGSGCPAVEGEHRNLAVLGWSPGCVATHPSDMAVAMTLLDAVVHIEGDGSTRSVVVDDLYVPPSEDPSGDAVLEPGELVTGIELPPVGRMRSRYIKARERASFSFALVSVAAAVVNDADGVTVLLALGGVAHKPWRAPEVDPESGLPFSSRGLVECLRTGAQTFAWDAMRTRGRSTRDRYLTGVGVAASTYPARWRSSQAMVEDCQDGSYVVRIAAADIGTGARTALAQVAADQLEVGVESVRLELGDSSLPPAPLAGGSMGTASWANAIARAVQNLRNAGGGTTVALGDTEDEAGPNTRYSTHGFGAQFVEVRVDPDTGEVRVPHMLGMFAVGRIVNPKTARSQLIGGMTMGVGMALMEESVLDTVRGDYLNRDLAGYHVPANADCPSIEVGWIEEHDREVNPLGIKGIRRDRRRRHGGRDRERRVPRDGCPHPGTADPPRPPARRPDETMSSRPVTADPGISPTFSWSEFPKTVVRASDRGRGRSCGPCDSPARLGGSTRDVTS